MSYEDVLIREATERYTPWCSDCERDAEDCVCEELCDHFRSEDVGVFNSGADVSVFPAAPEYPLQLTCPHTCSSRWEQTVAALPLQLLDVDRGLEAEPYTYEEADARRMEQPE